MLFAFLSQRPRTRRQVWNMISQSHQRFQFCPSSPWSNCCTPVGGKRRMNSFSEYFFSVQTTQFIPVTNNIMRWNLKRTLFSSGVKWFIQSPTIPFLMNWPLPCLLHSSRTRYFVKSCIFPTYKMFFFPACALRALGLLLADGAPTVGRGKTFWWVN